MTFRFHIVSMIWGAIVLALGLMPASWFPEHDVAEFNLDKVIHYILYLVFSILNLVGFKKEYFHRGFRYQPVIFALVLVVTFSCATEILQNLTSTRSFEWKDILANLAGIGSGLICFRFLYGKRLFYA